MLYPAPPLGSTEALPGSVICCAATGERWPVDRKAATLKAVTAARTKDPPLRTRSATLRTPIDRPPTTQHYWLCVLMKTRDPGSVKCDGALKSSQNELAP
jgi:hypothetical protein